MAKLFFRRLSTKFQDVAKSELGRVKACQLIEEVLLSLAQEAGKEAVEGRQMLVACVTDDGEVCLWAVDSGEIYLREIGHGSATAQV